MKTCIIISLFIMTFITTSGCQTSPSENPDPVSMEPLVISDKLGMDFYDLAGFTQDKSQDNKFKSAMVFRKGDTRIQIRVQKGIKFSVPIPGVPTESESQLLHEWLLAMLTVPGFYPGTTKAVLFSKQVMVDDAKALVSDILLQYDPVLAAETRDVDKEAYKEEIAFFQEHPRTILRTYHFYRGKDLFHIEFFADPLSHIVEIDNVENKFVAGINLR